MRVILMTGKGGVGKPPLQLLLDSVVPNWAIGHSFSDQLTPRGFDLGWA